MSSEVLVVSAARNTHISEAIRQAVDSAGVKPRHVQDVVFGDDLHAIMADLDRALHAAGLSCPSVRVSSSLRALFFAAQSILSGDVEVSLVAAADREEASALVLAGPEAVGRWNLMPRARVAARSLAGPEAALRMAGITANEIGASVDGESMVANVRLLDELDGGTARWGMVTEGKLVLIIERVS
jgi:acetyl-CoA acetyltransferase